MCQEILRLKSSVLILTHQMAKMPEDMVAGTSDNTLEKGQKGTRPDAITAKFTTKGDRNPSLSVIRELYQFL